MPILWPVIFKTGHEIAFAHTSFKWANLASHNAGVTVIVVGVANASNKKKKLYYIGKDNQSSLRNVDHINAYLVPAKDAIVKSQSTPLGEKNIMLKGNQPTDGGHLCLSPGEAAALGLTEDQRGRFVRRFLGSREFIRGQLRYCLWIEDENLEMARQIAPIAQRLDAVVEMRSASSKKQTNEAAKVPHQFGEVRQRGDRSSIVIPSVSSEAREFLPVGLVGQKSIVSNLAFALYDAPLWNMALIASRLHLVWIATVCGKLKTDYRYSNTLGWNTFPVPKLTEKNKRDLTRCAEDILLAREARFPKTIADLYKPGDMPEGLRRAHGRNDETLERVYIGRRFKNDTERLEKLFQMYAEMTAPKGAT